MYARIERVDFFIKKFNGKTVKITGCYVNEDMDKPCSSCEEDCNIGNKTLTIKKDRYLEDGHPVDTLQIGDVMDILRNKFDEHKRRLLEV